MYPKKGGLKWGDWRSWTSFHGRFCGPSCLHDFLHERRERRKGTARTMHSNGVATCVDHHEEHVVRKRDLTRGKSAFAHPATDVDAMSIACWKRGSLL
jgi:hypothetical protein